MADKWQADGRQVADLKQEGKKEKTEEGKNSYMGRPRQNRFINYQQSYTNDDIKRIEELERAERLQDSRFSE